MSFFVETRRCRVLVSVVRSRWIDSLAVPSIARAQAVATSAALAGRVLDSSGAPVPGASVVATHLAAIAELAGGVR